MVSPSRKRAPPADSNNLPLGDSPADGGARPTPPLAAWAASIAQMYILRACRGIPLSPYAACGRKIGGGAAGRSVSNEKINL